MFARRYAAGLIKGKANSRLRGEMHDAREAPIAEQPRGRVRIGQVELLEREPVPAGKLREARLLEGDVVVGVEVVDADHRVAAREQRRGRVHPDETGRAGDQHPAHGVPSARALSARSFAYLRKLANAPIAIWAKPAAPSRNPSLTT